MSCGNYPQVIHRLIHSLVEGWVVLRRVLLALFLVCPMVLADDEVIEALERAAATAQQLNEELAHIADLLRPIEPPPPEAMEPSGILYSRVRRTTEPVRVNYRGTDVMVQHPDLYDALPEVNNIRNGASAPGQLVLLRGGEEIVLYDCLQQPKPCIAVDGVVSFDGWEAMFAVIRATGYAKSWHGVGADMGNQLLDGAYESQLHRVSLRTFEVTPMAHTPGTFDMSPVYLPGGGYLYTSDKPPRTWRPVLRDNVQDENANLRLWVNDADGDRFVGQADTGGTLHPFVVSDGQVIAGALMQGGNLAYRATNGSFNWPGTLDNLWWIVSVTQDGGHWTSLYGAHVYQQALHFCGESSERWVLCGRYYRGNNFGGGDVVMWKPEAIDVEGRGAGERGEFLAPRTLTPLAPWANARDEPAPKIGGRFSGKLRDPAGLPDGDILLTFARGRCSIVPGHMPSLEQDLARYEAERGCDTGIYRLPGDKVPSQSPQDLIAIVDSPDWHEFQAKPALAYRAIYNQDAPDIYRYPRSEDGTCQLKMASMESETTHLKGYHFGNFQACGMQGCELHGVQDSDIKGLRFWRIEPVPTRYRVFNGIDHLWGYRNARLGDVPVNEDGSAYVQIPCNTPYVMAGLDSDGRVIKRDQVAQALRDGEQRSCGGCHLHSELGHDFDGTLASQAPPTVLPEAVPVPEWNRDVLPYLEATCTECHARGATPWLYDYAKLVWDKRQEHSAKQTIVNNNPTKGTFLQRPTTSRYISSDFARASLLYWACIGRRDDLRSNEDYSNDIDYPEGHPGFAGCEVLGDWIDSGAYRE